MSDGHSNVNPGDTIPSAIRLRQTGCVVVVFAIGSNIGWDELNSIASAPNNHTVFVVGSYTQLPNILNELRQATANSKLTQRRFRHYTLFPYLLAGTGRDHVSTCRETI